MDGHRADHMEGARRPPAAARAEEAAGAWSHRLREEERRFDAALDALDALLCQALAAPVGPTAARSFGAVIQGAAPLPQVGSDAWRFEELSAAWARSLSGEGGDADRLTRVNALLGRVAQALTRFASVESWAGGAAVGVTSVGWTGDFRTVLGSDSPLEPLRAHPQLTGLALRRRHMWIRLAMMTVAAAYSVSVQLALPGGLLGAIPRVWRFIEEALDEIRSATEGPRPGMDPPGRPRAAQARPRRPLTRAAALDAAPTLEVRGGLARSRPLSEGGAEPSKGERGPPQRLAASGLGLPTRADVLGAGRRLREL